MKIITRCSSHQEADLIISRLDSEGLRVCLVDEYAGALGVTGGIGVKVGMHEEDLPRYRELVETDQGLRHLLHIELPVCPRCESRKIRQIREESGFWSLLKDFLMLISSKQADTTPTHRCHRCGYAGLRTAFDPPAPERAPEPEY